MTEIAYSVLCATGTDDYGVRFYVPSNTDTWAQAGHYWWSGLTDPDLYEPTFGDFRE